MSLLVRTPRDVTPAWLEAVLDCGAVSAVTVTAVGTGQMSQSHRVAFTAGGEQRSVVVKLASEDPTSRATGVGLGAYAREIRFYNELAPRIGGPLAACHLATYDEADGWFTLVLEDVAPASQGDQIAGCDVEHARLALEGLARLQAPVFGDVELGVADWLNSPSPLNQALVAQLLPGFWERYSDRVTAEHRALVERFVSSLDGWLADRRPPLGLAHGDYRLDNLLFGEPGAPRPLTAVDWQTVAWGSPMLDAAYFIGGGLTAEDRREHEEQLVRGYHDGLLAGGVEDFPLETCWTEYRRAIFHGIVMAVAASMLVVRTERGDDMFMTSLARHAQHAIDLDAVALLPEPGAGRPPALVPPASDEARHTPGPEELWNESWYFDAISDDGSLGAYVRVGLVPNIDACWYTAVVCGPGRPTVALISLDGPLPADDALTVDTDGLRAEHRCEEPLRRFAVHLDGTGEAHDDPAGLLRGETGAPIALGLDLVWETEGAPYAYRLATRYEIPCRVSGTVRVGDEVLALRGPGQRDHSWGVRDWWAMDWVWSAGALEDGTRVHAVALRIPDLPPLSVGYVQGGDAGPTVVELDHVGATETVAGDGLVTAARLELEPGGLVVEAEPIGHGPLRLEAPDGRLSLFDRAMCRLRAPDGRTGLGWMEWNRNQR